MKASELMIGDWVINHYYSDKEYPFQFGVGDMAKGGYNHVEPIPLTEEILKANGFKNCGTYEWRDEIFVTRYRYRNPENHDEMFELNFTPGYDGFNAKGFDVNEVHKLQHLLRLAKFNDLADNFKVN